MSNFSGLWGRATLWSAYFRVDWRISLFDFQFRIGVYFREMSSRFRNWRSMSLYMNIQNKLQNFIWKLPIIWRHTALINLRATYKKNQVYYTEYERLMSPSAALSQNSKRCVYWWMLHAVMPNRLHYYWSVRWLSIFGEKRSFWNR